MNTFFKTFFICMVVCVGFFVYQFLQSESYSPDLSTANDSPVYSNTNKYDKLKKNDSVDLPVENDINETPAPIQEKYTYTCYFYSGTGKLVPVKREFATQQSLQNIVAMLLKGPTIKESKQGYYSEIPKNVDLLSIKETKDKIIVNLSSKFGQGGGSESVENRVKQLSKTVKNYVGAKKIYLYIDNKEVEYLGGEGVYITQPLN